MYVEDFEDKSPERKHCKSCTCCSSTIILEPEQNNHNKSDKTTETELSDDLVTVAASRIFNRSGKTQVVKKMCMKNILNEIFDDVDPTPYTSIEKVEEKKKNAQKKGNYLLQIYFYVSFLQFCMYCVIVFNLIMIITLYLKIYYIIVFF